MNSFNKQSVLFAVIIMFFVLISRHEEAPEKIAKLAEINHSDTYGVASAISNFQGIESGSSAPRATPDDTRREVPQTMLRFARPETASSQHAPSHIHASALLLTELGSPYELFVHGRDKQWPLASITKLMTAVVAEDVIGNGELITITDAALVTEGESGGFVRGETYSLSDIIGAMLVTSSNDAAEAVAAHYGRLEFISRMQEKAQSLGMTETFFLDPTGLSVSNQSTVSDMAIFARYLLAEHPEILEKTARPAITITDTTTGAQRNLLSNNKFAGMTEFIGGKTGYTNEAHGNLLSIFEYGNRRFLSVVFGSEDRFGDTEKLIQWAKLTL
jgi:D-alanyl-D-alanine carboxypeptidase